MGKSHVELDFFGLDNQPQPRLHRRQSFRGISKINPEIVKSVIASNSLPQLPVFHPLPFSRPEGVEKAAETAPMTIFYNGTVSVFDLPKDKAESIMNFAMEMKTSMNDAQMDQSSFNDQSDNILEALDDGDLPIKRKKSLQRFFEKRKERLISASPYPIDHVAQHPQKTSVV